MSDVTGLIIRPDKTITELTFTCLKDYQEGVEGYIEAVTLSDGSTMFVNEEGRIYRLPFNSIATDVAGLGGRPDILLQGLLGPVVLVGPVDGNGNTTSITAQARNWVQRVADEA